MDDTKQPDATSMPSTAQQLPPGSSQQEVQANEFRSAKLPTFWRNNPKLWFCQLESYFEHYHVRSDDVRYHAVVRQLDEQTMLMVSDLIVTPPTQDKYQTIKDKLITRLSESEESQFRKLLSGLELGDKRPTGLLREMRALADKSVPDRVLKTLWLQRLPKHVQEILTVVETVELDKLAEMADKTIERTRAPFVGEVETHASKRSVDLADLTGQMSQIMTRLEHLECDRVIGPSREWQRDRRPRQRSRFRSREDQKGVCYYHKRFGPNAERCTTPCSWLETGPQKN
ncbi:uncharacterized protein LOC105699009 [Orussus abietinus]|uniref:uncharacterized protein LOC105699009 n=1 Tax=Orussus abietinus TaxID=222816 RepID=UPI0006266E48|nr:uncharacterized protein LOC105699009 [Orussus abietinus]